MFSLSVSAASRGALWTALVLALVHPVTYADSQATKRDLATKLAQIQLQRDTNPMVKQLVTSATHPLITRWSQRIERISPDRQQEVRDQLDVELKKFTANAEQEISAQVKQFAEEALVPIFMERLTEDEMWKIIGHLESPSTEKFQSLGPEAAKAWAKEVVQHTQQRVQQNQRQFDTSATAILAESTSHGGRREQASSSNTVTYVPVPVPAPSIQMPAFPMPSVAPPPNITWGNPSQPRVQNCYTVSGIEFCR